MIPYFKNLFLHFCLEVWVGDPLRLIILNFLIVPSFVLSHDILDFLGVFGPSVVSFQIFIYKLKAFYFFKFFINQTFHATLDRACNSSRADTGHSHEKFICKSTKVNLADELIRNLFTGFSIDSIYVLIFLFWYVSFFKS